jgi:hypothetical protein
MAFDISTARPYEEESQGFDISTAKPYEEEPQETGFINDLRTASRERGLQVTNPEPSALSNFSPTLGTALNVAGAAGGLGFDVVGAGLKAGLGALGSLASVDKKYELGLRSAKDLAGKAYEGVSNVVSPIAEKVKEFDPGVYHDIGRVVDATGLGMAKPAAQTLPSVLKGVSEGAVGTGRALKFGAKETSKLVDDIFAPAMGKTISQGTVKAGIIPKVSRGYEDINKFKQSMQDVVPDIVKNKKDIAFLDSNGALQKGVVPESVEEWSQVIKPRKDAIMNSIVSDLKKAGVEGATISNQADLSAIREIKKTDAYKAMANHKEYDDVIAKLDEMENRYSNKPSVSPSEYNADITTLNTLVSSKADTLSDVFYIHLLQAKRKELAKFMDRLGGNFQERKNLWGKYNDIEAKVAQRANQLSKAPKSLGYWNMASLAEGIAGVATGNPAIVGSAVATGGIAKLIHRYQDPNRAVKKMFDRVDRKMGKEVPPKPPIDPLANDVSGIRPTPLGLPMPERGFTLKGEQEIIMGADGTPRVKIYPTPKSEVPTRPPDRPMNTEFTATPQRQIRGFDQPLQLPERTYGNYDFTMPEGTPYLPQVAKPIRLPEGAVPPQGAMEQGRIDVGVRGTTQKAMTPQKIALNENQDAIKLAQENIPSNPSIGTNADFKQAQEIWKKQAQRGEITPEEFGKRLVNFKVVEPTATVSKPSKGISKIVDDLDSTDMQMSDAVVKLKKMKVSDDVKVAIADYEKALEIDRTQYGMRSGLQEVAENKLRSVLEKAQDKGLKKALK